MPDMRRILALACLFLTACPSHKVDWQTLQIENGCLVNARGYEAAYTAANSQAKWFWSRILVIRYELRARPNSHSVAIVQWPDGIYAYEQQFGARRLTTNTDLRDPMTLARIWGNRDFLDAFYKDATPANNAN